MKNVKYLTIAAYILIAALFFTAGFFIGVSNGRGEARQELEKQYAARPTEAVNASAAAEQNKTEYALILENGRLVVYELFGGAKKKLTEHEISEAVYPGDDIAALKAGMIFYDKNAAMAMFENFAS